MRNKKLFLMIGLMSLLLIIAGCGKEEVVDPATIKGTAYIGYTFGDATFAESGSKVSVHRITADGTLEALTTTAQVGAEGKFTLTNVPKHEKLLVTVEDNEITFQAPTVVTTDTVTVDVTPSTTIFYDVLADRGFGYLGNTCEDWATALNNTTFMNLFKDGMTNILTNVETNTDLKSMILNNPPENWYAPVVYGDGQISGALAYATLMEAYETLVYTDTYDARIRDIRDQLISEVTLGTSADLFIDGDDREWDRDFRLLTDPEGDIEESVASTVTPLTTYNVGYDLTGAYGATDTDGYYFALEMSDETRQINVDSNNGGHMAITLQFSDTNQMYPLVLVVKIEDFMNETFVDATFIGSGTPLENPYGLDLDSMVQAQFDADRQFVELRIDKIAMELISAETNSVYMFGESYIYQESTTSDADSLYTDVKTTVDTLYFKKLNF